MHTCYICQKQMLHKRSLKVHLLVHSGVKQYECNICKKKFTLLSVLRQHILIHAINRPKPYKCDVCKKQFTGLRSLKHHMFTHSGAGEHQCTVCKKRFSTRSYLKYHIRGHAKVKPYECTLCKKKYSDKATFNQHLSNHIGDRTFYQCDLCSKQYLTKISLARHMSIHSGKDPVKGHTCDICQEQFIRKSRIISHMRIHLPSDNTCDVCNEQLASASALTLHMKRYHMETRGSETSIKLTCGLDKSSQCEVLKSDLRAAHFTKGNGLIDISTNSCQPELSEETQKITKSSHETNDGPLVVKLEPNDEFVDLLKHENLKSGLLDVKIEDENYDFMNEASYIIDKLNTKSRGDLG